MSFKLGFLSSFSNAKGIRIRAFISQLKHLKLASLHLMFLGEGVWTKVRLPAKEVKNCLCSKMFAQVQGTAFQCSSYFTFT